RHVQAGQRKRRSPHQRLEYTTATSFLSLEISSFLYICLYSHLQFPEIIKYALLVYFWEPSGPSKARMRANSEVRSALPSAKSSLPRGLLRGEPSNVPKKSPMFFEIFPSRPQASRILGKNGRKA